MSGYILSEVTTSYSANLKPSRSELKRITLDEWFSTCFGMEQRLHNCSVTGHFNSGIARTCSEQAGWLASGIPACIFHENPNNFSHCKLWFHCLLYTFRDCHVKWLFFPWLSYRSDCSSSLCVCHWLLSLETPPLLLYWALDWLFKDFLILNLHVQSALHILEQQQYTHQLFSWNWMKGCWDIRRTYKQTDRWSDPLLYSWCITTWKNRFRFQKKKKQQMSLY